MNALFMVGVITVSMSLSVGASTRGREGHNNDDEHARLIEVVKQATNGEAAYAVQRLIRLGRMEELLHILMSTTSPSTIQAIAQTRDDRTIPILEARLRRDPSNVHLVGSLAFVQHPRTSPILIELLRRHGDAEQPSERDVVGLTLNAIILNRCLDATPLLRERFAACEAASQAQRKSDYALTLLALGDPIGTSWLSEQIGEDIDNNAPHSFAANRLATLCDWQPPQANITHLQDEAIFTPLLPVLVRGASSPRCRFSRDCVRTLRVLTRHDFPEGDTSWQQWYQKNAARHPIYSKPLDRTVELCVATFREKLKEVAQVDKEISWAKRFLEQPEKGWGSYNDFLWKLHSEPEYTHRVGLAILTQTPPRQLLKDYGISFSVSQTSRFKEPEHLIFRQDIDGINLTVCLASPTSDQQLKDALIAVAKEASVFLTDYERFYVDGNDSAPGKSGK